MPVMPPWHYTRDGLRQDPVDFETLCRLARSGQLDPARDLVWTHPMKDWMPAGTIRGLFSGRAPIPDATSPDEIVSDPSILPPSPTPRADLLDRRISVSDCLKRGLQLTIGNFGMLLIILLLSFCVQIGAGWMMEGSKPVHDVRDASDVLHGLVSQFLAIYLTLGLTRIGLNLVDGQRISPAMLFGEWDKLARSFVASLLFAVMSTIGLMLLIVPGVYLLLRYGQCLTAIVDRDLGIFAAFAHSSAVTRGNRLRLLMLFLASCVVLLVGILAFGVGLLLAIPVVWLSWLTAYRWMDRGRNAALGGE